MTLLPPRSSRLWTLTSRQFAVVVIALTIAAAALGILGIRIDGELSTLSEASSDNLQWEMAQFDVELLVLINSVKTAQLAPAAPLTDVRNRFDIFYSRVAANSVRKGELHRQDDGVLIAALKTIEADMRALFPLMDGPDEGLRPRLAELADTFERLRSTTRNIELEYVRLFAEKSDADRQYLASLIQQAALISTLMIAALLLSILFLVRQFQVSVTRAAVIQESNDRFENTIYASLDAILVTNAEGAILEFNPAAERMFGISRAVAVGAQMTELIIPERRWAEHRKRVQHFIASGEFECTRSGRLITTAQRAGGEEFPVELSLRSTFSGSDQFLIGFVRDISDRIRTERELIEARDAALAAARAKSNFLAFMSHEMRTPLNGVLAILDLMRTTPLDDRQRSYIDTATMSGEILLHHIGDVLDLNRIEADVLTIREEEFDLAALVEEVAAINRPIAATQKDSIEVRLPGLPLQVRSDRGRLRQILMNLVGNAVKFTRQGVITIEANVAFPDGAGSVTEWANVELAVVDTGIGIPADQLAHIFKEFVTLETSDRKMLQGTGLGLAISHRIADMLGGKLTVASALGAGSRFSLQIPLRVTPGPGVAAAAPLSVQPSVLPRQRLSVLLVEDNETNRFVGREMLESMGAIVTTAEDGREGVALAEAEAFDLILMDVNMPNLDGIGATSAITQSSTARSRHAPIVGLTAHVMPEDQENLLAAGMRRCLFKPVRLNDLRALMIDLFGPAPAEVAAAAVAGHPDDAEAPDEDEGLLDHECLAELSELLARDQFAEWIGNYRAELATLAQVLADDHALGGTSALGQAAHRLAGSAAVFGAPALRAVLIELEQACRRRELGDLAEWQARAGNLAERTAAALNALVDDLSEPVAAQ